MSCVSGLPPGAGTPASRARLSRVLWTAEERKRQRKIIEERLIDAWAWKSQSDAVVNPKKPWLLESGEGVMVVVKPPWRPTPGPGPHYSEPALGADERARLAVEALTWVRRYLLPLASAPRGSRHREKWETLQLWLNCRAHRPGHPSFNSVWHERAHGDRTLERKLKRCAYRRVERAIRMVKLGLFADGVVVEPLPPRKK